MDLNYLAFFLISFVPLIIALYWYSPSSIITKWSGQKFNNPKSLSLGKILCCWLLSVAFVYGYINLIIHQLGFYELFFTDIMLGSTEAEQIVSTFLAEYGNKHRHVGHGVLHGFLNAFIIALPFVFAQAILDNRSFSYIIHHFGYWLLTSIVVGGLISQFV